MVLDRLFKKTFFRFLGRTEKIFIVLFDHRKIPFINFAIPCPLPYGFWFICYRDHMGMNILLDRLGILRYEENCRNFIQKFLKPGMIFFDIGANQGFYTILAAKIVGLGGKVFAFEPAPAELRKLKLNIYLNRLKNVIIQPLALASYDGVGNMYFCLGGKGSLSSLRPPAEDVNARTKIIKVRVTTLDSYVQRNSISKIDFIKIDAEGAELDILKGSLKVLRDLRPIIMCEVADIRTKQFGYKASEICYFLEKFEYSCFQISSDGKLLTHKIKIEYYPDWENLIFVPIEKLDEFKDLIMEDT
jgi:FkbM family methyltransferase